MFTVKEIEARRQIIVRTMDALEKHNATPEEGNATANLARAYVTVAKFERETRKRRGVRECEPDADAE